MSDNIRYLRKKKGFSQEYIAEKMGYSSYTTVQKWETGVSEPPIKKLRELSEILDVDINDITSKKLYLEENQEPTYYLNDE
ncbi:MAG: helix-turn-helix transcriptional regulator, partial [Lachnospiraceae bacterium]|nr:helix-turn-helix transcriptional regulator [Lachnospiraceae bacterium]